MTRERQPISELAAVEVSQDGVVEALFPPFAFLHLCNSVTRLVVPASTRERKERQTTEVPRALYRRKPGLEFETLAGYIDVRVLIGHEVCCLQFLVHHFV